MVCSFQESIIGGPEGNNGGLILGGFIGGQKLGSITRGNIGGQVPKSGVHYQGGITGGQGLKLGPFTRGHYRGPGAEKWGPLIGALLGEGGQGGRKSESIQGARG